MRASRRVWLEISVAIHVSYGFNMPHMPPQLRVPRMLKIHAHMAMKASLGLKRLDLLYKHLKQTCLSQRGAEVMRWILLSLERLC